MNTEGAKSSVQMGGAQKSPAKPTPCAVAENRQARRPRQARRQRRRQNCIYKSPAAAENRQARRMVLIVVTHATL